MAVIADEAPVAEPSHRVVPYKEDRWAVVYKNVEEDRWYFCMESILYPYGETRYVRDFRIKEDAERFAAEKSKAAAQ